MRARRVKCQRPRYVPTEAEVDALAAVAPSPAMFAFTLTAAYSGLRLFEVAALEVDDFDPAGTLHVRRGKGSKERTSLLYEPGLSALEVVLPKRGLIWRTSHGNGWSRQHVARLWKGMREELDLPAGCTFHALRHFHACWLIDKGARMHDVAVQLGHADNGALVRRLYGRMKSEEAARGRLDGLR